MENKKDPDEKEYIQAYNLGYKIAKYSPEIGELLVQATGKSEKLGGMKDGSKQYRNEKSKDRTPSWLKDRAGNDRDTQGNLNEKTPIKDVEPERD